jgi:aldose 1-epimerase
MADCLKPFGQLTNGAMVQRVDISNGPMAASFLTYGARLYHISLAGSPNLTVSTNNLTEYETDKAYYGPIIAPVVNRISSAAATINGTTHQFETNQDGQHSLHSGQAGTQYRIWAVEHLSQDSVTFNLSLDHGVGGFPGQRELSVTYTLTENALDVSISATTDRPTIFNPALHGYWDLNAGTAGTSQQLRLPAAHYLPTDNHGIPTGELLKRDTQAITIENDAHRSEVIDHNYCYTDGYGLRAVLTGQTGRSLELYADTPGLQVYTGAPVGIALEPQSWPNAPNTPNFPSIALAPGEMFRQKSSYRLKGMDGEG